MDIKNLFMQKSQTLYIQIILNAPCTYTMEYRVDSKAEIILNNQEAKIVELKQNIAYVIGIKVPDPVSVWNQMVYYSTVQFQIETVNDVVPAGCKAYASNYGDEEYVRYGSITEDN